MTDPCQFDLIDFLPYLLNIAAEETSLGFSRTYKERYGMLRTEWRVLFHLGRYGPMTARDISDRARTHKTKVSRAVAALEARRFLMRERMDEDLRQERLSLTAAGSAAYKDLCRTARVYDAQQMEMFTASEQEVLRSCLQRLARLDPAHRPR